MTLANESGGSERALPEPRILVVVPTLGERLETLARTLASIQQQAGVLVDCIVVAPRETTELSATVGRHGARLILDQGRVSAAINAGFALASDAHRYCCWIGDDDMLRPESLRRSSAALDADPGAVVAFGSCDYIDFAGKLLFTRRPPPGASLLLQFVPGLIKQETCLFRLSALRTVGGLDIGLRYAMDLDLLLKLRREGRFARVDAVTAAFCWHPGSMTIANRDVSFAEAQGIQLAQARGLSKLVFVLFKGLIRSLLLAVNGRINRAYLPAAPSATTDKLKGRQP